MGIDLRSLKIAAAREALREVESGMTLGLGTGSTAVELVRMLALEIDEGRLRDIAGVCTSSATATLASQLGIRILEIDDVARIDLAIDGADEIDPALRLIKGHGGALLREKIVEQHAARFIVIADETKLVDRLGQRALPVEVVPFASRVLLGRFARMGFEPSARMFAEEWFVTDEGNHILDIRVPVDRDIADVVGEIREHAGVVDTGFFPDEADEAIIALEAGVRREQREEGRRQR